jgi:hypothetical protein
MACFFPIKSCHVRIMQVIVHTIWSVYGKVMILEIIVVFCINCPSFILLFVVIHLSLCFFISFEILNEPKLIHHYINGNSYRINLPLNVLLPKSILVVTIHYFSISFVFLDANMSNCGWWWSGNQLNAKSSQLFPTFKLLSTIHFICHLFPSLRNSYGF